MMFSLWTLFSFAVGSFILLLGGLTGLLWHTAGWRPVFICYGYAIVAGVIYYLIFGWN